MKTGFGDMDVSHIENTGFNLLGQLMEFAVINGAKYSKSAGRNNLSGQDIIYALQYEAHEFPFRNLNTNDYSSSEDEDSESEEFCNEEDDKFTRSSSQDELIVKMNNYHDNWDTWEPELDIQKILKNAVTKAIESNLV